MDNSTLPPLFDSMDNVDISLSTEDPDIFQSAIVRISFVFLIISPQFFRGVNLALHFPITHTISREFLRGALILCWCAATTPHSIHAGGSHF